jgi:uncharacterized membrane protein
VKKIVLSIILAFIFILSPVISKQVFAKDYSITSADITAQINSTGSVDIKETRTYSFSGSYSWADENINLVPKCGAGETCQNYKIYNVNLSEGGLRYLPSNAGTPETFQVTDEGSSLYIKWFYSAIDTQKTFTLSYTVQNALTNQEDISEFYWQLIGDKWAKGVDNVSAKVVLPYPAPSNQVWAWTWTVKWRG